MTFERTVSMILEKSRKKPEDPSPGLYKKVGDNEMCRHLFGLVQS